MTAAVRARRRPALAPAVGELRRVRAELAAALAERDEWRGRAVALAEAIDHEAERAVWAQLAAQLAGQARAEGEAAGYARAVADFKRGWHEVTGAVHLAGIRRGPGGAAWLADVERHGGTEYGGQGRPRVPVAPGWIAAAREMAR